MSKNTQSYRKTKRIATAVFALGCFLLFGCRSNRQNFSFVFMTDIHVQPELDADSGFRAAVARVNGLKPNFVITGGDLIMDALGKSFERSTALYRLFSDICTDFEMPVYHTLGNHEVFGLFEESGIDPDHPEYGKEMFKNRLGKGKTYYSFDYKGWHIIILDGVGLTPERGYIGLVDEAELVWLESDLEKVDKKIPIAVSVHIPMVSVYEQMKFSPTAALGAGAVVNNSLEVSDLFRDHNLKLVLQGHLHIVEEIIYRGVHYITGGAVCGSWWKGARDGFPEGFVLVTVRGEEFDWEYVTFGWNAAEHQ
jgi:Icc protein